MSGTTGKPRLAWCWCMGSAWRGAWRGDGMVHGWCMGLGGLLMNIIHRFNAIQFRYLDNESII